MLDGGDKSVVSVRDVEVLRTSNWAIWCRCRGKEFYVPLDLIRGACPAVGETGNLDVPEWFAADHGLFDRDDDQ